MRVVILLAYLTLTNITLAALPPKVTLLTLAKEKFQSPPLSTAEKVLFVQTEAGEPASALTWDSEEDDPANAANWTKDRAIRAETLIWLCTDSEASKRVTHRGIDLEGMRIDGKLDLQFAQIPFPVRAWKCAFAEEIVLRQAHLQALYLLSSHVKNVEASGVKIDGNLFFRDSKSEGQFNLIAASIGGDLSCNGSHFVEPKGTALYADGAKINGSVFFRDGFKSEGEVNLKVATIGGTLDCSGAQLTKPGGKALDAYGVRINGYVYLRNGFKAEGQVDFGSALIAGDFQCDGAQLINPAGDAFYANRAKIDGHMYFRNHFKADGALNFENSNIAGYLVYSQSDAPEKASFDLRAANVGTLWDDEASWPKAGNLLLDGFVYGRIHDAAPVSASSRIRWLQRQPSEKFSPQPFEQLAQVLRSMGHDQEARNVMIAKNEDHARFTQRFSQEWWWYNALGKLIGYGYQPWRAFLMSLGMIVIGWLVFRLGYTFEIISPTKENAIAKIVEPLGSSGSTKRTFSEEYPKFNAFVYSLESFTPLLKLDQSSNWAPNANRGRGLHIGRLHFLTTGSLLRIYLWCHIIAGWILTSLWVGSITGLVKT